MTHYALIPPTAAAASTIFYIVTRAGLLSTNPPPHQVGASPVDALNPFGFAAVAALVGLFTEEAMQMLKRVAGTVFAPPEPAQDQLVVPKPEDETKPPDENL